MKYAKTKEILNQAVADLSQMSMVIHQTHWYMSCLLYTSDAADD